MCAYSTNYRRSTESPSITWTQPWNAIIWSLRGSAIISRRFSSFWADSEMSWSADPTKIKCNLLLIYAENEISMSDKFGGIKLINELKYANNCEWNYEANLEIIKDSSHQLFLNQPIKCVKAILKHTHNIDCDWFLFCYSCTVLAYIEFVKQY